MIDSKGGTVIESWLILKQLWLNLQFTLRLGGFIVYIPKFTPVNAGRQKPVISGSIKKVE